MRPSFASPRPTLDAHVVLDSGRYDVTYDYLPAEPDAGLPCDGWELVSLRDASGAEIELDDLAARESAVLDQAVSVDWVTETLLELALDEAQRAA